MASVRIECVKESFTNRLLASGQLLGRLSGYRFYDGNLYRFLSASERENLVEIAFLRVLIAWEDFLEESFIRYMKDAHPKRGKWPRPYMNPKSLEHARSLLLAENMPYLDWNNPQSIIDRAKRIFKFGNIYISPISQISQNLDQMRIIRIYFIT